MPLCLFCCWFLIWLTIQEYKLGLSRATLELGCVWVRIGIGVGVVLELELAGAGVGVGLELGWILLLEFQTLAVGWVGVDYHYTSAHSGPNPQVFSHRAECGNI